MFLFSTIFGMDALVILVVILLAVVAIALIVGVMLRLVQRKD